MIAFGIVPANATKISSAIAQFFLDIFFSKKQHGTHSEE